MLKHLLDNSDYTVKNALTWGIFAGHCKKATKTQGMGRFIQIIILSLEVIPGISQIVSLAEMAFMKMAQKRTSSESLAGRVAKDYRNSRLSYSKLIDVRSPFVNQALHEEIFDAISSGTLNEKDPRLNQLVLGDINKNVKNDQTLLECAAAKGNLEIVKFLVEKGAVNDRVRSTGLPYDYSPLYYAALNGHVPVVKYLTDLNANISFYFENNKKKDLISKVITESTGSEESIFECIKLLSKEHPSRAYATYARQKGYSKIANFLEGE